MIKNRASLHKVDRCGGFWWSLMPHFREIWIGSTSGTLERSRLRMELRKDQESLEFQDVSRCFKMFWFELHTFLLHLLAVSRHEFNWIHMSLRQAFKEGDMVEFFRGRAVVEEATKLTMSTQIVSTKLRHCNSTWNKSQTTSWWEPRQPESLKVDKLPLKSNGINVFWGCLRHFERLTRFSVRNISWKAFWQQKKFLGGCASKRRNDVMPLALGCWVFRSMTPWLNAIWWQRNLRRTRNHQTWPIALSAFIQEYSKAEEHYSAAYKLLEQTVGYWCFGILHCAQFSSARQTIAFVWEASSPCCKHPRHKNWHRWQWDWNWGQLAD